MHQFVYSSHIWCLLRWWTEHEKRGMRPKQKIWSKEMQASSKLTSELGQLDTGSSGRWTRQSRACRAQTGANPVRDGISACAATTLDWCTTSERSFSALLQYSYQHKFSTWLIYYKNQWYNQLMCECVCVFARACVCPCLVSDSWASSSPRGLRRGPAGSLWPPPCDHPWLDMFVSLETTEDADETRDQLSVGLKIKEKKTLKWKVKGWK